MILRRITAFIGGGITGRLIGAGLALLFSPISGQDVRQHYANSLEAGRSAAEFKRQELEAKLAEMTTASNASAPQNAEK